MKRKIDIKEVNKLVDNLLLSANIENIFKECIVSEEENEVKKIEDDDVSTRLLEKNYSLLIVRKYCAKNWPLFVGMICDLSLSDLDSVVQDIIEESERFFVNDIQELRNFCGYMSDKITQYYNYKKKGSVEGVAVLLYTDKLFISSLTNDFMTHGNCKLELFQILNMMTQI
jgi:UDP-galactopyranose mutase